MNQMRLTDKDNQIIAEAYPGGEHLFTHQDLDIQNLQDTNEWFQTGDLVGLVSEVHGGIIGYVHKEHVDGISSVLNLYAIERGLSNEE